MCDLSIIVPVYNVENYIRCTIESLLEQRKMDCEIILVDDGSKDSCGAICDRYKTIPNIKIIHKENGGLADARKAGLKAAKGRYIGFLDGDDWIDEDYYYNMLEKAKLTKSDVICSSFVYSYPGKEVPVNSVIADGLYKNEKLECIREIILYTEPYYTYGIVPSLCMKLIKKTWLDKYLMSVPNYVTLAEDASCSFPIMFNCESIYILHSNCGYHYRQIGQSMTRRYDPDKINKVLTVIEYFNEIMGVKYFKYQNQVDKFLGFLIKDIIGNEIKSEDDKNIIKSRLLEFRRNPIVDRTLNNIDDLPFFYRILFLLYKNRYIDILVASMKMYNKVLKKEQNYEESNNCLQHILSVDNGNSD